VSVRTETFEPATADELLVPDDSGARRAAVRAFRPRRVFPAVLAASSLTAVGATAAAQAISTLLSDPLVRVETSVRLGDPAVLGAGAGVALAGLLLVLSAVIPGRARTVALAGDDPAFVMGIRRSSLRTALLGESLRVPGVEEATVRLRGRLRPRATVHACTGFRNPGNLGDQLEDAVRARLDDLGPVRRTRVAVHLSHRRD
jgi:hypothetical protein